MSGTCLPAKPTIEDPLLNKVSLTMSIFWTCVNLLLVRPYLAFVFCSYHYIISFSLSRTNFLFLQQPSSNEICDFRKDIPPLVRPTFLSSAVVLCIFSISMSRILDCIEVRRSPAAPERSFLDFHRGRFCPAVLRRFQQVVECGSLIDLPLPLSYSVSLATIIIVIIIALIVGNTTARVFWLYLFLLLVRRLLNFMSLH